LIRDTSDRDSFRSSPVKLIGFFSRLLELLPRVPYKDLKPVEIELPPRQSQDYQRPKKSSQRFVPEIY
jgi:hypothetical protein